MRLEVSGPVAAVPETLRAAWKSTWIGPFARVSPEMFCQVDSLSEPPGTSWKGT
jgi:hypothetical protein